METESHCFKSQLASRHLTKLRLHLSGGFRVGRKEEKKHHYKSEEAVVRDFRNRHFLTEKHKCKHLLCLLSLFSSWEKEWAYQGIKKKNEHPLLSHHLLYSLAEFMKILKKKKVGFNCFAQTQGRWLLFQCHLFPSLASRHLAWKENIKSRNSTSASELIG